MANGRVSPVNIDATYPLWFWLLCWHLLLQQVHEGWLCLRPLLVICAENIKYQYQIYSIRIYHECEGRIEKSVLRIAFWHHEACRVMTNGDPEGRIFLSYPHKNNGFFSCSLLFLLINWLIKFKNRFQKSLNTLRSNFTWWCYLTSWVR